MRNVRVLEAHHFELGAISPVCGKVLQVRPCRPILIHILCVPRLRLPPLPPLPDDHQAMVQRSPRSCQRQSRLVCRRVHQHRLVIPHKQWWIRRVPGGSEFELHHAIPRSGLAVSHEGEGQDGHHQDGTAAWGRWEGGVGHQEPNGRLHVDPLREKGHGRGSKVSPGFRLAGQAIDGPYQCAKADARVPRGSATAQVGHGQH